MKIEGRWLDDVKTEKGLAYFKDMYETTPEQMMEDYETKRVTMLTISDTKYIVFVDGESTDINMKFTLENEHDIFLIHAQEGLQDYGVFNTDGIAFMYAYAGGESPRLDSIENSPYDLSIIDIENAVDQDDTTIEAFLLSVGDDATLSNTKFVAQL